jgi:type II secretory pathway component PulC
MPKNNKLVSKKEIALISPSPVLDLQPYDASANAQARDIFSLTTTVTSSGSVENTPKGQLPDHLKVVGILIAHPSQIIIEDTSANTTYFIDQDHPQDGIKMLKVAPDQMTINYQGQDIIVPVTKS